MSNFDPSGLGESYKATVTSRNEGRGLARKGGSSVGSRIGGMMDGGGSREEASYLPPLPFLVRRPVRDLTTPHPTNHSYSPPPLSFCDPITLAPPPLQAGTESNTLAVRVGYVNL
eukprot:761518-Hanusia_phi.AAC.7